jgi:hypothetical protein
VQVTGERKNPPPTGWWARSCSGSTPQWGEAGRAGEQ